MGASLGCFAARDSDAAENEMLQRTTRPRSDSAASLMGMLQRSFSSAWLAHVDEDSEFSRAGTDHHDECSDLASWDVFLSTNSSAAASSGCRMLSREYSQALELGGNSFFIDVRGEPVHGRYLDSIEVMEEYFGADMPPKHLHRRELLHTGSTMSVLDDDDERDCCASTMDLETDLDMERFLTQSSPPTLTLGNYSWHAAMPIDDSQDALMLEDTFDHAPFSTGHSMPMPSIPMPPQSAPASWSCTMAKTNAWEPAKQRALASYYIGRLPRGSVGELAIGNVPSIAS